MNHIYTKKVSIVQNLKTKIRFAQLEVIILYIFLQSNPLGQWLIALLQSDIPTTPRALQRNLLSLPLSYKLIFANAGGKGHGRK